MRWLAPAATILLLLAAAGAVAFSFLLGDERPDRDARSTAPPAEGFSNQSSANRKASARERAPSPAPIRDASRPAATALSSTPRLRGTIVVLDSDGRERATEDGDFRFVAWSGDSGVRVATKVTAGRFEAALPPCDALSVERLRLGGRLAVVDFESVPPPPDGVLALRARWPAPVTLKVVDDRDGHELDRVVVFEATLRNGVGLMHPGVDAAGAPVVDDAQSPIVLPERGRAADYWVRSPGYAWHRVDVDHSVGGEHVVQLKAGGTIEIQLTNYRIESKAMVRVRRSSTSGESDSKPVRSHQLGRPDVEVVAPPATGTILEALVPGDYRVSVEIGSWVRRPVVLGSANVAVEAGTTTTVTIRLAEPPPMSQSVPLRGTVELPPQWGDLKPELCLMPLDELGALAEPSPPLTCRKVEGVLRWDAGNVLPGRYAVILDDPPFSTMLVVDPRGTYAARIVVPQPASVVVRATDIDTRRPVPIDAIQLERLSFPARVAGRWGCVTSMKPDKAGVFRARVPAGRMRVSIDSPEYVLSVSDQATGEWQVRPGHNEITILVTRPSGIRVNFPDLAATDSRDDKFAIVEFGIEIRALGGDGKARLWRYGPTSQTFVVTTAGSYEVKVLSPSRFKSVAPHVVNVRRAQIAELTVNLERRE